MKEQDIVVLSLDHVSTRAAICASFRSPTKYARLRGLVVSTLLGMLNGSIRYCANPASVYQAVLRQMRTDGVLVEESDVREAA